MLWPLAVEVFWIVAVVNDAVGDVVSIVTLSALDVSVAPASVAPAVIEYVPPDNAAVVHDQAPVVEFAVHALPEATPFAYNCTVEPPVAVPAKVAVLSLVMLSEVDEPVSLEVSRSGVDVLANV